MASSESAPAASETSADTTAYSAAKPKPAFYRPHTMGYDDIPTRMAPPCVVRPTTATKTHKRAGTIRRKQ
ncbi:hypothetical protein OsI_29229 [Oryza sativa Indica Group]|jgi:hypothetical protein|uniref:Uncharacterized protein n=3 Tax=Oryza TaxID=4527 RepID=A0A0D3H071_9ORYZ|nr:hypothetical protein OsI_29229 [Oryza sativa Indica Group]